jgi:hypothetical protein
MTEAPEADYPEAAEISFELEQLTLTDDLRFELSGRWFGVRGRRFVRPTLTLIGASGRSRSLAGLEHKPWAAEDGELWVAMFPVPALGEDTLELELAVAPDIAVMLPPPAGLEDLPRERVPSSDAVVAPRTATPPLLAPAPEPAPAPRDEADAARDDELADARARLEEQGLEIKRLEEQLARAAGAEARERDAARRERDEARRERDEARTGWKKAHDGWRKALLERDQAAADRQRAIIDRDHASAARDRAVAQRDQAIADRDRARSERRPARMPDPVTVPVTESFVSPAPPATQPLVPAARPVAPQFSHRPSPVQQGRSRPGAVWAGRVFALLVLMAAVIMIVVIIHSA